MDTFEDDNPFDQENVHVIPPNSSSVRLDFSEPSSPRIQSASHLPVSPSPDPQFPSPESKIKVQGNLNKTDFCCNRDRYLHSGENTDILVGFIGSGTRFTCLFKYNYFRSLKPRKYRTPRPHHTLLMRYRLGYVLFLD